MATTALSNRRISAASKPTHRNVRDVWGTRQKLTHEARGIYS
jgi:hypothetical protein